MYWMDESTYLQVRRRRRRRRRRLHAFEWESRAVSRRAVTQDAYIYIYIHIYIYRYYMIHYMQKQNTAAV